MSPESILDPDALVNLRLLSPDDGGAFMRELIEVFLQDAPTRMEEIESGFAARDAATVSRAAHTIKGSAGNFGAKRLAAVSLRMEQLAKEETLEEARALLPDLKADFAQTVTALTALLSETG